MVYAPGSSGVARVSGVERREVVRSIVRVDLALGICLDDVGIFKTMFFIWSVHFVEVASNFWDPFKDITGEGERGLRETQVDWFLDEDVKAVKVCLLFTGDFLIGQFHHGDSLEESAYFPFVKGKVAFTCFV
jgi:hypothetical protein